MSKWVLALGVGFLMFAAVAEPPAGLARDAWICAALFAVMVLWWFTEALPVPATALLPILVLPLSGAGTLAATAASYMAPVIFLVLAGALIALALEKSGLHRRIALAVVSRSAGTPGRLVLGFMAVTAFLSMWVSNTATALIMMPIAMSVVRVLPGSASAPPQQNFATALVLGVAYAASIGGMGTLIGSPTNGIAAAIIARTLGIKVSFADWLAVGLPLVLMAIPLCWWLLTRWVFRIHLLGLDRAQVLAAIGEPGPWSLAERRLLPLLLATVCGWIALPWLKTLPGLGALDDSMIGLVAALLLFVIPVGKTPTTLLTWRDTDRAPWDLVILFGGGLALAEAITRTGLSTWIGGLFVQMQDVPVVVWILAVTALVILATEAASNVAAAASFVPIVVSAAVALGFADRGIDPLALVMPAAIAASWGFVMPAGTPPNAIAYSTGQVRVRQMLRAGVWIDLLGILIIPAICWLAYVVLR